MARELTKANRCADALKALQRATTLEARLGGQGTDLRARVHRLLPLLRPGRLLPEARRQPERHPPLQYRGEAGRHQADRHLPNLDQAPRGMPRTPRRQRVARGVRQDVERFMRGGRGAREGPEVRRGARQAGLRRGPRPRARSRHPAIGDRDPGPCADRSEERCRRHGTEPRGSSGT